MLEYLASWLVNYVIGPYVENLDSKKLSVGYNGLEIRQIKLKCSAFKISCRKSKIKLISGSIGYLKLIIPYRHPYENSWIFCCDDVFLEFSVDNFNDEELKSQMLSFYIQHIKRVLYEQLMDLKYQYGKRTFFGGILSDSIMRLHQSLMASLLNHMEIEIKSFYTRFHFVDYILYAHSNYIKLHPLPHETTIDKSIQIRKLIVMNLTVSLIDNYTNSDYSKKENIFGPLSFNLTIGHNRNMASLSNDDQPRFQITLNIDPNDNTFFTITPLFLKFLKSYLFNGVSYKKAQSLYYWSRIKSSILSSWNKNIIFTKLSNILQISKLYQELLHSMLKSSKHNYNDDIFKDLIRIQSCFNDNNTLESIYFNINEKFLKFHTSNNNNNTSIPLKPNDRNSNIAINAQCVSSSWARYLKNFLDFSGKTDLKAIIDSQRSVPISARSFSEAKASDDAVIVDDIIQIISSNALSSANVGVLSGDGTLIKFSLQSPSTILFILKFNTVTQNSHNLLIKLGLSNFSFDYSIKNKSFHFFTDIKSIDCKINRINNSESIFSSSNSKIKSASSNIIDETEFIKIHINRQIIGSTILYKIHSSISPINFNLDILSQLILDEKIMSSELILLFFTTFTYHNVSDSAYYPKNNFNFYNSYRTFKLERCYLYSLDCKLPNFIMEKNSTIIILKCGNLKFKNSDFNNVDSMVDEDNYYTPPTSDDFDFDYVNNTVCDNDSTVNTSRGINFIASNVIDVSVCGVEIEQIIPFINQPKMFTLIEPFEFKLDCNNPTLCNINIENLAINIKKSAIEIIFSILNVVFYVTKSTLKVAYLDIGDNRKNANVSSIFLKKTNMILFNVKAINVQFYNTCDDRFTIILNNIIFKYIDSHNFNFNFSKLSGYLLQLSNHLFFSTADRIHDEEYISIAPSHTNKVITYEFDRLKKIYTLSWNIQHCSIKISYKLILFVCKFFEWLLPDPNYTSLESIISTLDEFNIVLMNFRIKKIVSMSNTNLSTELSISNIEVICDEHVGKQKFPVLWIPTSGHTYNNSCFMQFKINNMKKIQLLCSEFSILLYPQMVSSLHLTYKLINHLANLYRFKSVLYNSNDDYCCSFLISDFEMDVLFKNIIIALPCEKIDYLNDKALVCIEIGCLSLTKILVDSNIRIAFSHIIVNALKSVTIFKGIPDDIQSMSNNSYYILKLKTSDIDISMSLMSISERFQLRITLEPIHLDISPYSLNALLSMVHFWNLTFYMNLIIINAIGMISSSSMVLKDIEFLFKNIVVRLWKSTDHLEHLSNLELSGISFFKQNSSFQLVVKDFKLIPMLSCPSPDYYFNDECCVLSFNKIIKETITTELSLKECLDACIIIKNAPSNRSNTICLHTGNFILNVDLFLSVLLVEFMYHTLDFYNYMDFGEFSTIVSMFKNDKLSRSLHLLSQNKEFCCDIPLIQVNLVLSNNIILFTALFKGWKIHLKLLDCSFNFSLSNIQFVDPATSANQLFLKYEISHPIIEFNQESINENNGSIIILKLYPNISDPTSYLLNIKIANFVICYDYELLGQITFFIIHIKRLFMNLRVTDLQRYFLLGTCNPFISNYYNSNTHPVLYTNSITTLCSDTIVFPDTEYSLSSNLSIQPSELPVILTKIINWLLKCEISIFFGNIKIIFPLISSNMSFNATQNEQYSVVSYLYAIISPFIISSSKNSPGIISTIVSYDMRLLRSSIDLINLDKKIIDDYSLIDSPTHGLKLYITLNLGHDSRCIFMFDIVQKDVLSLMLTVDQLNEIISTLKTLYSGDLLYQAETDESLLSKNCIKNTSTNSELYDLHALDDLFTFFQISTSFSILQFTLSPAKSQNTANQHFIKFINPSIIFKKFKDKSKYVSFSIEQISVNNICIVGYSGALMNDTQHESCDIFNISYFVSPFKAHLSFISKISALKFNSRYIDDLLLLFKSIDFFNHTPIDLLSVTNIPKKIIPHQIHGEISKLSLHLTLDDTSPNVAFIFDIGLTITSVNYHDVITFNCNPVTFQQSIVDCSDLSIEKDILHNSIKVIESTSLVIEIKREGDKYVLVDIKFTKPIKLSHSPIKLCEIFIKIKILLNYIQSTFNRLKNSGDKATSDSQVKYHLVIPTIQTNMICYLRYQALDIFELKIFDFVGYMSGHGKNSSGSISFTFQTDIFNMVSLSWESLTESLKLQSVWNMDKEKSISIHSSSKFYVNFSCNALETLQMLLKQLNKCNIKSSSNSYGKESKKEFFSYDSSSLIISFVNKTGFNLRLVVNMVSACDNLQDSFILKYDESTLTKNLSEYLQDEMDIVNLAANGDSTLYKIPLQKNKPTYTHEQCDLLPSYYIQLISTFHGYVESINLENIGCYYRLIHSYIDNHKYILLCNVNMDGYIRRVIFTSPLSITNNTPDSIQLKFYDMKAQRYVNDIEVSPGGKIYLPINYTRYDMFLSTQVSNSYGYHRINWNINKDVSHEFVKISHGNCCVISIRRNLFLKNSLQKKQFKEIKLNQDELNILLGADIELDSYLKLKNSLPYDVALKILDDSNNLIYSLITCAACSSISLNSVVPNSTIKLVLSVDSFSQSNIVTIPLNCNSNRSYFIAEMRDNNARNLSIMIYCLVSGDRSSHFILSVPCWIINKTSFPLLVKLKNQDDICAGQYIEHESAKNSLPLMLSFPESYSFSLGQDEIMLQIRLGKKWKSDFFANQSLSFLWCEDIPLIESATYRVLVARADNSSECFNALDVGIVIKKATFPLIGTWVVSIVPRYLLENHTNVKLSLRSKYICDNATVKLSSMLSVLPNSTLEIINERIGEYAMDFFMLTIKCCDTVSNMNYGWSNGFNAECEGSNILFCVSSDSKSILFFHCVVKLVNSTYFIRIFDASTHLIPITVRNQSSVSIDIQSFEDQEFSVTCQPMQQVSCGYDFLSDNPFIIFSFYKTQITMCLNTIRPSIKSTTYVNYCNVFYIYVVPDSYKYINESHNVCCENESMFKVLDYDPITCNIYISLKQNDKHTQFWYMTNDGFIYNASDNFYSYVLTDEDFIDHKVVLGGVYEMPIKNKLKLMLIDKNTTSSDGGVYNWTIDPNSNEITPRYKILSLYNIKDNINSLVSSSDIDQPENIFMLMNPEQSTTAVKQKLFCQYVLAGSGCIQVQSWLSGVTYKFLIKNCSPNNKTTSVYTCEPVSEPISHHLLHRQSQYSDDVTKIHAEFSFSVTFINQVPEEIVSLHVKSTVLNLTWYNHNQFDLSLVLVEPQIDNKIMECPNNLTLFVLKDIESNQKTQIRIDINSLKIFKQKFYTMKNFTIDLCDFCVYLDELVILKLVQMFNVGMSQHVLYFENTSCDQTDIDDTKRFLQNVVTNNMTSSYLDSISAFVYSECSIIKSFRVLLSYKPCVLQLEPHLVLIHKKLNLPSSPVQDVIIIFSEFQIGPIQELLTNYLIRLQDHIKKTFKSNAAYLLLSLNALGNPMGFISDLSSGMDSLVFEGDITNLIVNIAHGISDSFAKVTDTVSTRLKRLSPMDHAEITMTRRLYHNQPIGSLGHLAEGIESFGAGFETGISDMIMKPIKGASSKGIKGFVSGLGTGIGGGVTKIMAGVLDMTSATFTAIRESARPPPPKPSIDRERRYIYRLSSAFYEYNEQFVQNQISFIRLTDYSIQQRLIWYCNLGDMDSGYKIMVSDCRIYIIQNSIHDKDNINIKQRLRFVIEIKDLYSCCVCIENRSYFLEFTIFESIQPTINNMECSNVRKISCKDHYTAKYAALNINYIRKWFFSMEYTLPTLDIS